MVGIPVLLGVLVAPIIASTILLDNALEITLYLSSP